MVLHFGHGSLAAESTLSFTKRIVELNLDESEVLLKYLFRLVHDNHDLQVRYTWQKNDVAIWSNASSLHNGPSHDARTPQHILLTV